MPALPTAEVFARALDGDRRMLARAISYIEDRRAGVMDAVADLPVRRSRVPGAPHVIGLTGPPGAGKSTFTSRFIERARVIGHRVAVVAVDPSSPFTGGAILGDRVRMDEHSTDAGVFVRSLASRGHLGGLSRASGQVVDLLDAAGFDLVIVETVGVGQSELSVMEVADTVAVILTPESGDTVQTMKAGLLEIADLFVINKADRPGAAGLQRDLELMINIFADYQDEGWQPRVKLACALEGWGVDEVGVAAEMHMEWCTGDGLDNWREHRAAGRVRTFLDLVGEDAREQARIAISGTYATWGADLRDGVLNPYRAAARWTERE